MFRKLTITVISASLLAVGAVGAVGAAGATEPTAGSSVDEAVTTSKSSASSAPFADSVRVEQVGNDVHVHWNASPLVEGGGSYAAQVIYSTGLGADGSESRDVKTGMLMGAPADSTSLVYKLTEEQWNTWWQDPQNRPNFVMVRVWAKAPNGEYDYASEWGIPIAPPDPKGVIPSRPATSRNIKSELTMWSLGNDGYHPVQKGEVVSINMYLYASAGSFSKQVQLWWYPENQPNKPRRIGTVALAPQPLFLESSRNPGQTYFSLYKFAVPESGRVVGRYDASPGRTVDRWGAIQTNSDTSEKGDGTWFRVAKKSPSRVVIKGSPQRTVKKGKRVPLKAVVSNVTGVKRVMVLDGGKVIGEARLNKQREWVFKYKVKPGSHRIDFKVIGSTTTAKSNTITVTGRVA